MVQATRLDFASESWILTVAQASFLHCSQAALESNARPLQSSVLNCFV
jgi:hypothetical protein